jgi:protein-disulfide isomerase
MASRAQQKEEARQRRLAEERAAAERARKARRLQMIIGSVLIAVIVVGVAIVISTNGGKKNIVAPNSKGARAAVSAVNTLLAGIPQSGNRLGAPTAKVTVTEYGDLECPICKDFALAGENQLISKDVRSGQVQLVYRSLCTATCNGPNQSWFPAQQAAALAAGLQAREWYYVEIFYHEQQDETTSYVNDNFLGTLAKQVQGLNYAKWSSDRASSTLTAQVTADQQQAQAQGYSSTPTLVVQGPKGQKAEQGAVDYNTLESDIKQVS